MSPLPIPGPASSPVSQIPHLACVPPPGPQESSCSLDCLCSQQSLPSGGNKMTERLFPAPQGFPGGSEGKESACNAGDLGLIPGLGRCPGEGKGCPLHYSCLENSMDRGAWWATVRGVAKSLTRLSDFHLHFLAPRVDHYSSTIGQVGCYAVSTAESERKTPSDTSRADALQHK